MDLLEAIKRKLGQTVGGAVQAVKNLFQPKLISPIPSTPKPTIPSFTYASPKVTQYATPVKQAPVTVTRPTVSIRQPSASAQLKTQPTLPKIPVLQGVKNYFTPTVSGQQGFWGTPVAKALGKIQQVTQKTLLEQAGKGAAEWSTLGLYKSPVKEPETLQEKVPYGIGAALALLNPLNPINKFQLFGKLETIGTKAVSPLVKTLAPKATTPISKFLVTKALPAVGAETAQTLPFLAAMKVAGQEPTPSTGLGMGLMGLGTRGGFGVLGKMVGGKIPGAILKQFQPREPAIPNIKAKAIENLGKKFDKYGNVSIDDAYLVDQMFNEYIPGVPIAIKAKMSLAQKISELRGLLTREQDIAYRQIPAGMRLVGEETTLPKTPAEAIKPEIPPKIPVKKYKPEDLIDLLKFKEPVTPPTSGSVLEDIQSGFKTGRIATEQVGTTKPNLRTQLIDKLTPVYDLVKQANKELPAEINPYKRMRLLAGLGGKIQAVLEEGLGPVLKRNANNLDDLSSLLILDRSQELSNRGLATRYSTEQISKGLQELRLKYGNEGFSTLRQSANEIRNYGSKLLKTLRDSGIIDEASYKAIKSKNEFYTPFQIVEHIADNLENNRFGKGTFNVATQDVLKKIKGSEKTLGDPLEAIIRQTTKIVSLSEKNKALQSLINLRKVNPLFKDLIQPMKEDVIPAGMDKISLFENGKNVDYAVSQEVGMAIKNLNAEASNVVIKILSFQAKILRAGATGFNIGFIPANVVRDMSNALYGEVSEHGITGATQFLFNYPEALASSLGQGKLYKQWLKSGGSQSSLTSQLFTKTPKTVQELAGNESIISTLLKSPKTLIQFVNRVGEESTRLAEFKTQLQRGVTPLEAAYQSRDITVDFAKSGTALKTLNQIIPFLNANVQGTEKMFRYLKNNPVKATLGLGLLVGTPTTILYLHNRKFKDYNDIQDYEKVDNWIIIARDRTPEEVTNGDSIKGIKIPKGQILQPFASITEEFLRYADNNNPKAIDQLAFDTLENISPIGFPIGEKRLGKTLSTITPPGMEAGIEYVTGKNLYTGLPTIPRRLEEVAPSYQYTEKTPSAYVKLGEMTGLSPLKIQSAVQTMAGGVGRQMGELLSGNIKKGTLEEITRRFTDIRGGAEKNIFYEKEHQLTETKNTLRHAYKEDKPLPKNADTLMKAELLYKQVKEVQSLLKYGKKEEAKQIVDKLKKSELWALEIRERAFALDKANKAGLSTADRNLLRYEGKARAIKIKEILDGYKNPNTQAKKLILLIGTGFVPEDVKQELRNLYGIGKKVGTKTKAALPATPPNLFSATVSEVGPQREKILPSTILGTITGGKGTFSQGFGARPQVYRRYGLAGHEGEDYVMPMNTPIRNPFSTAIVEKIDYDPTGYGQYIGLRDTTTNQYILLGHFNKINVRQGQTISGGQVVGLSGGAGRTAGHSDAPHLHISYTPNYQTRLSRAGGYGGFVNPSKFLRTSLKFKAT